MVHFSYVFFVSIALPSPSLRARRFQREGENNATDDKSNTSGLAKAAIVQRHFVTQSHSNSRLRCSAEPQCLHDKSPSWRWARPSTRRLALSGTPAIWHIPGTRSFKIAIKGNCGKRDRQGNFCHHGYGKLIFCRVLAAWLLGADRDYGEHVRQFVAFDSDFRLSRLTISW